MRRLSILFLAIVVALWAETTARGEGTILRDAVLLYALAGALFLSAAWPPAPWPGLASRPPWRSHALLMVAAGVLLGGLAWVGFWARRDDYTGWPFILWLVGTGLLLIGAWWDGKDRPVEHPVRPRSPYGLYAPLSRHTEIILLTLIVLAALVLRIWHLGDIPNGCQSDECNNALDALRWLNGEPYVPYTGTNEGQATLFTYIIAGLFALFGASVKTLRLVPALMGTLTILAFYALARWRFASPRLALVLAGLFAASRWHITFSRIVYELIMVPLVISLLLWVLLRALRHGRRGDWALVGFFLALGMNTYTAFRVVPLWIAVFFLYWLAGDIWHSERRQQLWRDIEGMALSLITFIVSFAPLGVYTLRHWDQFTSRIRHISVFNDVRRVGSYDPIKQNLLKTLKMFNVQGDLAPLNNLPGEPMLDVVIGALFVLGVIYALRYVNRPLPFLYTTGIIFQMSLVVLSVAHEAPSARRPIGILVIVYLLVGEVLAQVWRAFDVAWRRMGQNVFQGALALLVVGIMVTNAHMYFGVQAELPEVQLAYSPNESAVGQYIRNLPPDTLVLVTRAYNHHSAVKFIGGRDVIALNLSLHVPLREQVDREVVYILDPPLQGIVPFLQKVYPDGLVEVHRGPAGVPLFISFRVTAENMQQVRGLRAFYYSGPDTNAPLAFERTERAVDLNFRTNPPLIPPFTVELRGALLVPTMGTCTFTVETEGDVSVLLDNRPLLETSNGSASARKRLVAGFVPFRLVYHALNQPGYVRLTWAGPGIAQQVLAEPAVYAINIGPNGLIGYYYPNAEWQGPPAVIQRDFFIIPNNILQEPFSIRWVGKIAIPVDGTYRFATRSDDGSYVFIDGQMVVDNGGTHGAQMREGSVYLTKGFHDIEVRYFQQVGASEMAFFWVPPGGVQEIVPLEYLFPIETEDIPETLTLPGPPIPQGPVPPTPGEDIRPPAESGMPGVPPLEEGGTLLPIKIAPLWAIGSCGDREGQFNQPRGIGVSPDGRIFVADTGNQRIVVLSPDGDVLKVWGEKGERRGQFLEPFEIAITPEGQVWVLDSVRQLLLRFDDSGTLLNEVVPTSPWYRPRGMALAPDGTLYIADTGGVRVTQVAPDGTLLRQIGGKEGPVGPGQPTDVAVAPNGSIFVVEAMAGQLWLLDASGTPIARWSIPSSNTIDAPHLALSQDGRLLVTSPPENNVRMYTFDGTPLGQWGTQENLLLPTGITVDSQGNRVYVTDAAGCRILAYPLP